MILSVVLLIVIDVCWICVMMLVSCCMVVLVLLCICVNMFWKLLCMCICRLFWVSVDSSVCRLERLFWKVFSRWLMFIVRVRMKFFLLVMLM